MSLTGVYLVEEVLALPAEQRRLLAQILLESVQDDGDSDEEIPPGLRARLDDLKSGRGAGMSFEEVFDEKL